MSRPLGISLNLESMDGVAQLRGAVILIGVVRVDCQQFMAGFGCEQENPPKRAGAASLCFQL